MPTTEVVPLPRKPAPPPSSLRSPRFSPRKFAEAWDRRQAEDPAFSVAVLMLAAGARSERTLRNWRAGRTTPDANQAMALAAALGLPPLGLFE